MTNNQGLGSAVGGFGEIRLRKTTFSAQWPPHPAPIATIPVAA